MTVVVREPKDTHPENTSFDLKVSFDDRRLVTEENALILSSRYADHLAYFGEEQLALQMDLHEKGNIVFIGDIHLCHEFNEKEFDRLIDTIENWVEAGKNIDRVVIYGDLIHKYDPRFTKLLNKDGIRYTNEEPYSEVIKRFNRAYEKLNRLKQILPSETELEYIFGNHELDICRHHPEFKEHFIRGLELLHINILTDDYTKLVTIGDEKDGIKSSHRPIIKWNSEVNKRLFKTDKEVKLFSTVKGFPSFVEEDSKSKISPGDIIVGGHYHVPWAWKDENQLSFVFAPSLITIFEDDMPCFREGFMVINPKASRKVHTVSVDGLALKYDIV